MPLPHRLYALVSHSAEPLIPPKKVVEIRSSKLQELKTKKAIDRAAKVLDRLEQRVADYDAQIQRVLDEYLKPLQLRKAYAQQRIERFEDEILTKLSESNLEHADGFHRQFQAVSCPKAVQVDDLSVVPNEYIRHKPEADKIAIKRALERNPDLVISGVRMTQKLRLVRK